MRPMLIALCTVLSFPAPSQAQRGATDNELYASYCKGVMDSKIATVSALAAPPNGAPLTPEAEQQRQTAIAPAAKAQQRFQSYLMSTGVLTDSERGDAFLGLLEAARRGQGDEKECLTGVFACRPAVACKVHQGPSKTDPLGLYGPTSAEIQCMGEYMKVCRAKIPSCPRADRCDGPDSLPF
jgi:hypothetical protein